MSPNDAATLRCLSPTADAALFSFGPLGDRVALPRPNASTIHRSRSGNPDQSFWERKTAECAGIRSQIGETFWQRW